MIVRGEPSPCPNIEIMFIFISKTVIARLKEIKKTIRMILNLLFIALLYEIRLESYPACLYK